MIFNIVKKVYNSLYSLLAIIIFLLIWEIIPPVGVGRYYFFAAVFQGGGGFWGISPFRDPGQTFVSQLAASVIGIRPGNGDFNTVGPVDRVV